MAIRYGATSLLAMMSGLIVWASCFVVLYVALSLGCRYGIPDFSAAGLPGLVWVLALLWLAHLALLGCMAHATWRRYRASGQASPAYRFALRSTLALHVVGFLATVVIGFPVLMMPPCAG